MTRKDYILIAAAVARVRNSYATHWDANLFRACNDHAKALADVLAQDNPRFDRARFLKACGLDELTTAAKRLEEFTEGRRPVHQPANT